jgi:hypothetical protein
MKPILASIVAVLFISGCASAPKSASSEKFDKGREIASEAPGVTCDQQKVNEFVANSQVECWLQYPPSGTETILLDIGGPEAIRDAKFDQDGNRYLVIVRAANSVCDGSSAQVTIQEIVDLKGKGKRINSETKMWLPDVPFSYSNNRRGTTLRHPFGNSKDSDDTVWTSVYCGLKKRVQ